MAEKSILNTQINNIPEFCVNSSIVQASVPEVSFVNSVPRFPLFKMLSFHFTLTKEVNHGRHGQCWKQSQKTHQNPRAGFISGL